MCKEIAEITRFPERCRIRIQVETLSKEKIFVKPDLSGTADKFSDIPGEPGMYWITKRLGGEVINIRLTIEGEHILNEICDNHINIGEMVQISVDNKTGNVDLESGRRVGKNEEDTTSIDLS